LVKKTTLDEGKQRAPPPQRLFLSSVTSPSLHCKTGCTSTYLLQQALQQWVVERVDPLSGQFRPLCVLFPSLARRLRQTNRLSDKLTNRPRHESSAESTTNCAG
jgi:hypothetical protein